MLNGDSESGAKASDTALGISEYQSQVIIPSTSSIIHNLSTIL